MTHSHKPHPEFLIISLGPERVYKGGLMVHKPTGLAFMSAKLIIHVFDENVAIAAEAGIHGVEMFGTVWLPLWWVADQVEFATRGRRNQEFLDAALTAVKAALAKDKE